MKIAKKLLAAVVAVMLVLSLSVCAFAAQSAETGDVKIESDWVIDEYDCIAVYVYFVDAVDLKSWDLKLHYDVDMFTYDSKAAGKDAKNITLYCNPDKNTFTDESNPDTGVAGEIKVGGYFKEVLWDAATFAAAANRGETLTVNSDKFNASIFYLKVNDAEKFNNNATTISIEGGMTFAEAKTVGDSITKEGPVTEPIVSEPESSTDPIVSEPESSTDPITSEPESTTDPITSEPESSTDVTRPTDEVTTRPITDDDDDCKPGKPGHPNCKPGKPACKPGKPGHKHPNTGDSAALAAAAGVVLLAGAAFVVSKKRK